MSNETPTWMAVLEAAKAYQEAPNMRPGEREARLALFQSLFVWMDDTSQGPEGYPMPDEPGTIAAMTPFQRQMHDRLAVFNTNRDQQMAEHGLGPEDMGDPSDHHRTPAYPPPPGKP